MLAFLLQSRLWQTIDQQIFVGFLFMRNCRYKLLHGELWGCPNLSE